MFHSIYTRGFLFPELGLSAYSIEDLTLQDALLDAVESAVSSIIEASRALHALLVIGATVRSEQRLFNCALVIHRGALLGIVPKTYLPDYREFLRQERMRMTSFSDCVQLHREHIARLRCIELDEVVEGDTRTFDRTVLLALRNPIDTAYPIGPPRLEQVARDVTVLDRSWQACGWNAPASRLFTQWKRRAQSSLKGETRALVRRLASSQPAAVR